MTDWVIDLDGVMWRGREPIPGAAETVGRLLERGDRVVFCTNNSAESGTHRAARLVRQGVPPGAEVVTSADAVSTLVARGERILCLGGPGLRAALAEAGAAVSDVADPVSARGVFDSVVVGLSRTVDYDQIDRASTAVRAGARLLASNADPTYPGSDGIHPGCGAVLAAVEVAAGVRALVAGKPHGPMADALRARLPSGAVVVGDRADTDGRLAERLGWPFGLVLSGITTAEDLPVDVPCAVVGEDLAAVVAGIDGSRSRGAPAGAE